MARIILSLVSVLLAFEVMAGMLIALLSLVHAIFNCLFQRHSPVVVKLVMAFPMKPASTWSRQYRPVP
jgi:hypothetical protein